MAVKFVAMTLLAALLALGQDTGAPERVPLVGSDYGDPDLAGAWAVEFAEVEGLPRAELKAAAFDKDLRAGTRTEHAALLRRIEREYGVPGRFVLAIWGLESRFGRTIGRTPVFQALATLAWEPRRAAFFRG